MAHFKVMDNKTIQNESVSSANQKLWSELWQKWSKGYDLPSRFVISFVITLFCLVQTGLATAVAYYGGVADAPLGIIPFCAGMWLTTSLFMTLLWSILDEGFQNNGEFLSNKFKAWSRAIAWSTGVVLGGAVVIQGGIIVWGQISGFFRWAF